MTKGLPGVEDFIHEIVVGASVELVGADLIVTLKTPPPTCPYSAAKLLV